MTTKKRIDFGKCPKWKKCKLYTKRNKVCNHEGGFYGSREAGCYRRFDKDKTIQK